MFLTYFTNTLFSVVHSVSLLGFQSVPWKYLLNLTNLPTNWNPIDNGISQHLRQKPGLWDSPPLFIVITFTNPSNTSINPKAVHEEYWLNTSSSENFEFYEWKQNLDNRWVHSRRNTLHTNYTNQDKEHLVFVFWSQNYLMQPWTMVNRRYRSEPKCRRRVLL